MRFNDKEMALLAQNKGQVEGRLQHRGPPGTFRDTVFRERYFRLVNNLLFYFRLNDVGQIDFKEPAGLIVLENYSVRVENESELSFAFGILFLDEPDKKHVFTARSDLDVQKWVHTIRQASYQHWKNKLTAMQSNITALKEARESILAEKQRNINSSGSSSLNSLNVLEIGESSSKSSPQYARKNPFLNQPPLPPPRANSPKILRKNIGNNNNNRGEAEGSSGGSDLIKF